MKILNVVVISIALCAGFVGTTEATVGSSDTPSWAVPGALLLLVNTGSSLLNGLFVLGGKGTEFSGTLGIFSGAASFFLVGVAVIEDDANTSEAELLSALAVTALPSVWLGVCSRTNARRMSVSPTLSRNRDGSISSGVVLGVSF